MRRVIFANNETYHVFNRGVEKRPTFTDKREYERAILTLDYYRVKNPVLRLAKALQLKREEREKYFLHLRQEGKRLIEVVSYCLMPNHFHFLIKQIEEGGVPKFISNFTNSYTRYFNTKNKRTGPLFQGIFKAVRIEDNEQLLHVSRYIHLNPVSSYVIKEKDLDTYPWSSFLEFLNHAEKGLCDKEIILDQFSSINNYRKFVYDQIDYAQNLETIRHLIFD